MVNSHYWKGNATTMRTLHEWLWGSTYYKHKYRMDEVELKLYLNFKHL